MEVDSLWQSDPHEYSTDTGFQNIGLPNLVFTVDNSLDNNPNARNTQ